MPNLYTASVIGSKILLNKSMISIYNSVGSGRIIKVYRLWMFNNQTAAVTGTMTSFMMYKIIGSGGGLPLQIVKYNLSSENLPTQISVTTGSAVTLSESIRQIIWSNDEPSMTTGSIDEALTNSLYTNIWNCGLFNSTLEPLTFREGEGISLYHIGSTSVGVIDAIIEFSSEIA